MSHLWVALCAYFGAGISEVSVEISAFHAADVTIITAKFVRAAQF